MGDKFTPSLKIATDFNNGNKYKKNDGVQAKTINNLIEQALFFQELALGGATIIGAITRRVEVSSKAWTETNGTFILTIPSTEHKLKNISSVDLYVLKDTEDCYENADFTYKIYNSGAVTIVLDKRVDCRIIIQGE